MNTGLGALTAGLRAGLDGRPFWPAFKWGALGGTLSYTGKRIIGTKKPALGIVGRQVAAVGGSAVRNAGGGRPPFSGAVLPFGPARLYLNEPSANGGPASAVRLKLDFAGIVALAYTASAGARLDLGASVAAGTLVFNGLARDGPIHMAEHYAGVIAVSVPPSASFQRRRAIAHELVHVAQYDFSFIAWAEPAERALIPLLPAGRFINRYLDVGVNMAAWGLGTWLVPRDQRPWEREAVLMTDRPWP